VRMLLERQLGRNPGPLDQPSEASLD